MGRRSVMRPERDATAKGSFDSARPKGLTSLRMTIRTPFVARSEHLRLFFISEYL
jgi:hypothetical protein